MSRRHAWMMVALLWCAAPWQVKSQERKMTGQRPGAPPRTFTNSIGMKFVWIDPGSFRMGSDDKKADEKPAHMVTLSKGFYLQTTEVTQRQWEAVMGTNPSYFKGPDRPVEGVSWEEAAVPFARDAGRGSVIPSALTETALTCKSKHPKGPKRHHTFRIGAENRALR